MARTKHTHADTLNGEVHTSPTSAHGGAQQEREASTLNLWSRGPHDSMEVFPMSKIVDGKTVKTKTAILKNGAKKEYEYHSPRVSMTKLEAYIAALRAEASKGNKNAEVVLKALPKFAAICIEDNQNVLKTLTGSGTTVNVSDLGI